MEEVQSSQARPRQETRNVSRERDAQVQEDRATQEREQENRAAERAQAEGSSSLGTA